MSANSMQVGSYLVREELARGGAGVIYRAFDPARQCDVVLKLLKVPSPSSLRRLQREARAMASLRHPNVVPLLDVGEHASAPFLVLPFVEGESLQERLDREGPFSIDEALQIGAALGQALLATHALSLVHRDVKPANVLLDKRRGGLPLLTDFGLVKAVGAEAHMSVSLSVKGRCLGTPGYWAREQAYGETEQLGPPADVYGLAATVFAMLSGQPPRGGRTLAQAIDAFERPVAPLSTLRTDAPPWLDGVLGSCFENEPAARPSLAALTRALQHRCPLEATSRGGGTPARDGGAAPLGAVVGLALAALVATASATWWVVSSGSATAEPATSTRPEAPERSPLEPGWSAFERDDFERALSEAEEALARDPDFAEAHLLLGLVREAREDRVRAVQHWARAETLGSERAAAHLRERYPDRDLRRLVTLAFAPEGGVGLAEAALLCGKRVDEPHLDVPTELARLDAIADRIRPGVAAREGRSRLEYLVEQVGLEVEGDSLTYNGIENGSLAQVLERGRGTHTSCGFVLIAVAARVGVALDPVCFPNWFHVRTRDDPPLFVNAYEGKVLTWDEMEAAFVKHMRGQVSVLPPALVAPSTRREALVRLLAYRENVLRMRRDEDLAAKTRDLLKALIPRDRERVMRRALGQR